MNFQYFDIQNESEFEQLALQAFQFQYINNETYKNYCDLIRVKYNDVKKLAHIPFLPISFFKSHQLKAFKETEEQLFLSSGTSMQNRSHHYIKELNQYHLNCLKNFEHFYGPISDYKILCYLPSYHDNPNSSLLSMCDYFFKHAKKESGFYYQKVQELIEILNNADEKTILLGVSYALLDLIELLPPHFKFKGIIMETGGMKGKRKEMIREELHQIFKSGFQVNHIHSEYGMSELLSQAYSDGNGLFQTPPWMKLYLRDPYDPLSLSHKKRGALNIIDLANYYSCPFIATDDLAEKEGKAYKILGRLDDADIRGCNLLIQ